MASNLNEEKKIERDSVRTGGSCLDGDDQLSAPSTTSKQNGDQAGCEDEQMSERDACERRRSGLSDLRICSSSPGALHRSVDEWPRRGFHIPRKIKERRGLLQTVAPDSREFEDLVKLLSSSYLDASSRGAFTYTKAHLVHNELLEKEFIEKKRELKQAGRTDAELTDSYAFLLPDPNKTHWICEKGLSVGHARISNLGNPAKGVYLSKYSDLLQMNPFEVGASGDIIVFKVMKGRLKSIFENTPKNGVEPSTKFDCHVHKNSSKVTSLLSYRAFELTQQYFYEFAFEELRSRPRHACPYAVLSFQYKGKELATGAHRVSSTTYEGHRGRRRYTVWSGPLVNKGEELYQVCIRSPSIPLLPFKLPDTIDISVAMHLDHVKRKIPSTLLSWDTYSGTQEAMKCGMYCSLFDVMPKSKQGSCLSGLLRKMEKDKMVFVKPLVERGFLFLLLSSHMHSSNDRRSRNEKGLLALFVFQESRITARFMSRHSGHKDDALVPIEPKDPLIERLDIFVPALHHAFFKLRSSPPKDLANAVKNQALDYLNLREQVSGRPFPVPEYRLSHDERHNPYPPQRPKGMDSVLNAYIHTPASFQLAVECLQPGLPDSGPTAEDDYSPVSDWSGSGSTKPSVPQSNGSGAQRLQAEYDKEKMERLLKLIQMHKRATGKEDRSVPERSDDWEAAGHKRRLEAECSTTVNKYLKTDNLSNGEPGRVPQPDTSLSAVMDSIGLRDTDLREHVNQNATINDAQTLLKLFLTAFKKVAQSSAAASTAASSASATTAGPMVPNQLQESQLPDRACESAKSSMQSEHNLHARHADEEQVSQDYLEDQMVCSVGSMDLCSPSSSIEQLVQRPAITTQLGHNRSERRTSTTVSDNIGEAGTLGTNRSLQAAGKTLDSILDQEFQSLSTGIQELMDRQKIAYVSQPPLSRLDTVQNRLDSSFSTYVLNHASPLPIQGYVNTLCEEMTHMISCPGAPSYPDTKSTATVPATPPPPPALQAAASLAAFSPVTTAPPAAPPVVVQPKQTASKTKSQELLEKPSSKPQTPASTPTTPPSKTQPSPTSKAHLGSLNENKNDTKVPNVVDSPKCTSSGGSAVLPLIPEIPPETAQTGAAGNNVIGQIKPEVLSTLVEIMQMNAVRFYIQPGEEEENQLFTEIKEYLKSLGNIECNPLTYLKNGCQQKFMVIIQNEDIASHIHKIPGLVSLKKMSTVYFAGVDSLDDVKNRTYNELFVSGGLIVSDELTLNPDFMTLEKLQGFLQFLEEQSGSWKWKVHSKTQKKLKELSRLNSQALDLRNLLLTYQMKHLVEILPYHECDAVSRQAPDLNCLVKLQSTNAQLRHIIFLTDKCKEAPKFSSNFVITASLNDIMTDFESLTSSIDEVPTLPITPPPVEPDDCMDEEDMSLDSDEEASVQVQDMEGEKTTVQASPPQSTQCQPPLGNPPTLDLSSLSSCPVDYSALKEAISQYKAAKHAGTSTAKADENLASFGVNPHQSYLFPSSAQWSPYSGSPSNPVSSDYSSPACSSSHGQEYSQGSNMSLPQGSTAPLSQPGNPLNQTSPTKHLGNPGPLANPQISSPVPNFVPEVSSCPQSSAQAPSLTGDAQLALPVSEDTGSKAMESASLSLTSSSLPSAVPSFPPMFLPPPPIPPLLPMFNWPPPAREQQSCTPVTNTAPFRPNEATASTDGSCVSTDEGFTPNEKAGGSTLGSASSSSLFPTAGMEQCSTPGSVTPSSQGTRTPVNSCTENEGGGQMPVHPPVGGPMPNRGGPPFRGLLPRPGLQMPPMCRGGPQGPPPYRESHPFGPRGPMPGTMDMRRGGFRGRGMPPMPMRSRPGRGPMRGGGYCNWGFRGPAKDYY